MRLQHEYLAALFAYTLNQRSDAGVIPSVPRTSLDLQVRNLVVVLVFILMVNNLIGP